MPGAGDLFDRYSFQPRAGGTIVSGLDRPGAWDASAAYVCAAQTVYLKGSEVQAARLQGDQPAVLTIRSCQAAQAIDDTWRAVDARNPARVLQILSAAPNKLQPRAFIDVLAVQKRGDPNG